MVRTTDFRKNLKLELEGKPYVIVEFQHINPGKGSAFVRTRLKNLETGSMLERTFKAGVDVFQQPDLEQKEVEFTYADLDGYNFIDQVTYESFHLTHEQVGDNKFYLQESIKLYILFYNGRSIAIELPNFVNLKVEQTDPGLKGDSASGGMKKAIMDTGLQISVPLFVKEGELLKIDTRTSEYVERVKE
jgi:elongation factor P